MFFILFESSESKCFDPQITKVSSQFSPIILIPLCYYVITKNKEHIFLVEKEWSVFPDDCWVQFAESQGVWDLFIWWNNQNK